MSGQGWFKTHDDQSPCHGCPHNTAELAPNVDVEEVEQYDDFEKQYPCVPVDVKNIVTVRMLPSKRSSMETFTPGITAGTAVLVQGADPRIRRVYFTAGANAVWIGTQSQIKAPNGPYGYLIAANTSTPPFEGVEDDLWAVCVTASGNVSRRTEYWAD